VWRRQLGDEVGRGVTEHHHDLEQRHIGGTRSWVYLPPRQEQTPYRLPLISESRVKTMTALRVGGRGVSAQRAERA
jgi:hypothetical protein